jgi:ketosteroid isomerase-like protein
MKTVLFILATTVIVASCANQNNSVNVQDLSKQFINAWNSKDSAKIDSLLAQDVQFLQADSHLSGKNDVAQKWVRESLPTINNLKTNVVSSQTDKNTAYEGGTFSVDVTSPDQPGAYGEGNYFFVWKKQPDNSWKINYIQIEDLPLQVAKR